MAYRSVASHGGSDLVIGMNAQLLNVFVEVAGRSSVYMRVGNVGVDGAVSAVQNIAFIHIPRINNGEGAAGGDA